MDKEEIFDNLQFLSEQLAKMTVNYFCEECSERNHKLVAFHLGKIAFCVDEMISRLENDKGNGHE